MKCPCCLQELPERKDILFFDQGTFVARNGQGARLTPFEYKVVIALRRRSLTRDELLDVLYADRADGGPPTAVNVLQVSMTQINKKLKALKLCVASDSKGARQTPYRLRDVPA